MRKGLSLLLLLCAMGAFAEEARTRTFAGGYSTRWKTRGAHGHDQEHPCQREYAGCDGMDFMRANLDNSLGYRAGVERDFYRLGMLRLVGGADVSMAYSEYNISQNDILIFGGAGAAGLDVTRWGFRLGARYGGGAYLTTERDLSYSYRSVSGFQTFRELVATVPLRSGASLRIARRLTDKSLGFENDFPGVAVEVAETSVMFVASPDVRESKWEFTTSSGATKPGGTGSALNLKEAGWHRLTASRDLPWLGLQARATWTASAQESRLHTNFRGYPGNERSKTVDGFGLGVWKQQQLGRFFSLHYGGGVEVADWRDDHHLLVNHDFHDVIGGVEAGLVAGGAVRFRIGRGTAIEAHVEQVHWTGISLGETRYGIGLALVK
ncbi:MAG TPA: hypothetical protein VEO54_19960 [Thermoanaerobaculia bacterium]|nr:hypothetical protein [Thermoanaerobaculia bacterium]